MTQLALIGILFGLCGIIGAGIALGFIRGPAEEQNYARLLQERLAGQLTRHVWKTGRRADLHSEPKPPPKQFH